MTAAISVLRRLDDARIWRGGQAARIEACPSGLAELDARLPGGGWPVGALTEVLHGTDGIGELGLVLPHLARVTQAGGRVALVGPPHLPFAPGLAQAGVVLPRLLVIRPDARDAALWATEQLLRTGVSGTVLAWPGAVNERDLRRLQLAAETGRSIGFLFRGLAAARAASPAALRLALSRDADGLSVELLKCRGGRPARLHLAA